MAAFLFHFRSTMAALLHQPTCQTLLGERLLHIRPTTRLVLVTSFTNPHLCQALHHKANFNDHLGQPGNNGGNTFVDVTR